MTISPQLPRHSRELNTRKRLEFEILYDAGNEVAGAFGLRYVMPEDLRGVYRAFGIDLTEANGDDSWTLPMPARYIVDRDGIIRYARVDPDYTVRPEPSETLDALRALSN